MSWSEYENRKGIQQFSQMLAGIPGLAVVVEQFELCDSDGKTALIAIPGLMDEEPVKGTRVWVRPKNQKQWFGIEECYLGKEHSEYGDGATHHIGLRFLTPKLAQTLGLQPPPA